MFSGAPFIHRAPLPRPGQAVQCGKAALYLEGGEKTPRKAVLIGRGFHWEFDGLNQVVNCSSMRHINHLSRVRLQAAVPGTCVPAPPAAAWDGAWCGQHGAWQGCYCRQFMRRDAIVSVGQPRTITGMGTTLFNVHGRCALNRQKDGLFNVAWGINFNMNNSVTTCCWWSKSMKDLSIYFTDFITTR